MATAHHCPECGTPVAADAPMGLCPRCVLKVMMAGPDATVAHAPGAEPAATGPEELARLFPQLEVLGPIGRGGMGVVYKARQVKLGRLVALKLIRPESADDAAFAERFGREARAMARLNHPNIVMVHDFGEVGGLYYLLMEWVDGADLRRPLQAGALPPERALAVALQVCDALGYAHAQGVVHRDIKPENILLDAQGRVKIADFGLAKLLEPSSGVPALTETRHVMGTPHYMAPEQRERPREVDHRADIYSLGVVLYEMLTGALPLGRYELPSETLGTDETLDEIVTRALQHDPARRYASVGALRAALAEFAEENYELPAAWNPAAPPPAAWSGSAWPSWLHYLNPFALFGYLLSFAITLLVAWSMLGWLALWIIEIVQGIVQDVSGAVHLGRAEVVVVSGAVALLALVFGLSRSGRKRTASAGSAPPAAAGPPASSIDAMADGPGRPAAPPPAVGLGASPSRGSATRDAPAALMTRGEAKALGTLVGMFFLLGLGACVSLGFLIVSAERGTSRETIWFAIATDFLGAATGLVGYSIARFWRAIERKGLRQAVPADTVPGPAAGPPAPAAGAGFAPIAWAEVEAARRAVRPPAAGLMVAGALNGLVGLGAALYFLTSGLITVWLVVVLQGMIILVGGLGALELKRRGLALTAGVLALFTPLLPIGLPFGIWFLAVLTRPEVVAAFRPSGVAPRWPGPGPVDSAIAGAPPSQEHLK
jgi:tRNA A-37 threonylcarbamoyl transferase component Bud32